MNDFDNRQVVVALLQTGRGRHGPDHHRPLPHSAQLLEDDGEPPSRCGDNSFEKVQNARGVPFSAAIRWMRLRVS
jgi:hypothetical protein